MVHPKPDFKKIIEHLKVDSMDTIEMLKLTKFKFILQLFVNFKLFQRAHLEDDWGGEGRCTLLAGLKPCSGAKEYMTFYEQFYHRSLLGVV